VFPSSGEIGSESISVESIAPNPGHDKWVGWGIRPSDKW